MMKDALRYRLAPFLSLSPNLVDTKFIIAVVIPKSVNEEIMTIKLAAAENIPNSETVRRRVRI